ncbi:MAG: hypothetical protein LBW77_07105 [Verrucomicrobiota bacterium]|jgi:hypothetical protein|nr:hypothetical protein [Verrucomicrobiota bacterium]
MKPKRHGLLPALLFIAAASGASAAPAEPVPRARILPDLVARADGTCRKLAKPGAVYGCRELFTSMLAYAEAGTNLNRVAELLAVAEQMQNREPGHPAYGNFRWYSRDADVFDYNAVDFCMQHGALLWRFHRGALDPDTRERLRVLLTAGLQGLVNHRPRTTYTNIALLNASDLVLLGEALDAPDAAREGERRLALFIKTLWEEGVHEFVSPTYYGVDLESMLLLAALAGTPETRGLADTLARYFWADIALNWHAPSQRLAGAHSRTYDYPAGYGELDQILCAAGWLPLTRDFRFSTLVPLYTPAPGAPPELAALNDRYPRLVEQTWGALPACARTQWVCRDVTLSAAWSAYPGRMDIALSADLPGTRETRPPRLSFIPDGRGDPYGKLSVSDGKTHSKAFHLSPWWGAAQDRADALGVAVYRDTDFKDATGTLASHLIFRKQLDSVWIGDTRVTLAGATNPVPPGAAVFLRQGTAAIGIRVPWTRGQDGAASPAALVDDGNAFGAARLTVTHAWLPSNRTDRAQAGAAFWLRVGSGLADDDAFAAFRRAFAGAPADVQATPTNLAIRVAGLARPLAVAGRAPFTDAAQTTPAPPATTLGLDGENVGRTILEESPVIQAYLQTRRPAAPIDVAPDRPTLWEAERGSATVPFETGADGDASGGAYLWVPEFGGQSGGGGGGRATYPLRIAAAGRYRLAGRVLTPTPDDDSFFLAIRASDGAELQPDAMWAPGVFTAWTWRDVKVAGQTGDGTYTLPQGEVTLILRPREAGSKIDQFRLTPLK